MSLLGGLEGLRVDSVIGSDLAKILLGDDEYDGIVLLDFTDLGFPLANSVDKGFAAWSCSRGGTYRLSRRRPYGSERRAHHPSHR